VGAVHRERAVAAWEALERACLRADRTGVALREPAHGLHRSRPSNAWPLSQVLHATALLRAIGVPAPFRPLLATLRRYHSGDGFTAAPGGGPRFYDDNAWLGLAAAQGGEVELARVALGFVEQGWSSGGGVRWREDLRSVHACSTGAAGLLALAVGPPSSGAAGRAERALAFLEGPLRRPDGLVADHLDAEGRLEPTVWSYNQGLAIGLHVELAARGRPVGDLGRAAELAAATLQHFAHDDALWRQPVAFNAVLLRLLLRLHAADGDPRWPQVVDDYLERAWTSARDPETGLFTASGIGRCDDGVALDQAGLVQLFALRVMPPQQWATVR
jgi:hypothetical protein